MKTVLLVSAASLFSFYLGFLLACIISTSGHHK
jgi:hypothetical protein